MIRVTKEGFKILQNSNGFSQLYIDSSRLDECLEYMISHNFKNIIISSYQGFAIEDLSFLSRIGDFIEGVVVSGTSFENTGIINTLHKLKFLGITDDKKTVIDLSNFPNLETCAVTYSPRLKALEKCKFLKDLTITNYKSNNEDLKNFANLASLRKLSLFKAKLVTLDGIEQLKLLVNLVLYGIPKLKTIKNLAELSESLEQIEIESCKSITDYEYLGKIVSLKKLIITQSGQIESLKFLKELKKLEFFSFVGTNVLDGDLSPCLGVTFAGFDNKKHYSHKMGNLKG